MTTTEPDPAIVRDRMRRSLRRKTGRRGIVDALMPQILAERAHAVTVDPLTPLYHATCADRRVWPVQDAGKALLPDDECRLEYPDEPVVLRFTAHTRALASLPGDVRR